MVVKCISSTSKDVKFPTLKYSLNGVDFFNASRQGVEQDDLATGVTASPAGINHTYAWDASGDLGATFDGAVKLKFGVINKDDTGAETQRTSDWFTLDFAPPVCSPSWPNGEVISDNTPTLQRNANDNSPPIETQWELDDDPAFGDAFGHKQTKAWSTDPTFTTAALQSMGTWYFRVMCRDSSPSVNTSAWSASGSFIFNIAIKPYSVTDGVDTVAGFIVDEAVMGIINRLREYQADGSANAGDANIIEWVHRKPCTLTLRMVDGPDPTSGTFDRYVQCLTWWRAKTLVDVHDTGGNPVGFGGINIAYIPSDWVIVNIKIINRPMRSNLLYYELILEEI